MRRSSLVTTVVSAVLTLAVAAPAQTAARAGRAAAPAPAAPKVLNVDDYGRWKRVTSAELSPDGRWMTYAYAPNTGDDTLFVKQLDTGTLYTVPVGSAPQFSDDSKWVGYYVSPPERNGRGGRSGRGAPPAPEGRAGRGAAGEPARRFELRNLATGDTWSVPNAAAFTFARGSRMLAVHLNRESRADTSYRGTDLLLRDLATGGTRNVGNVSEFAFDHAGDLLAYVVDARERLGNGVYLVDLASGITRPLDAAPAEYADIAWSERGADLAALHGATPEGMKQRANVLLAWTGLTAQAGTATAYDPAKAGDFPAGFVLSEFATPRWSDDGSRVFVGIKEQEQAPPRSTEPQADLDVWHYKDAQIQSVQIARLQQELRATFASAVLVGSGRFVQLADSAMPSVEPAPDGQWAVGRNDTTYRGEVAWGGSHADYYRVNTATGARSLIATKLWRTMGTSPDSKWFLYLQNAHIYAYNAAAGTSTQVDGGMNFVNTDDDHPYERPIWGLAGWSSDGHSALIYDKYDVWRLSLDGGTPVNLTRGVGKAQQIQFRVVRLDLPGGGGRGGRGGRGGLGAAPPVEDHGIDLSKPVTLSAYGEWTKKSGYWTLAPGQAPRPLIYEDKMIGQVSQAEHANRVIFTQQTFNEFPDYWMSGTSFQAPVRETDADPFIGKYAWGRKVLVNYTNSKGQRLQATLTLPAGYVPGRKYPMLVYFYEIMSNTHHQFSMPVYDDRPQMSTYASNGYLVLQPDVVYEIGTPGSSALDCVTSAVKKVIDLGYADPAHVGLQGHSWGGYQSSFILTQTSMFAAVVTGAPPTDLISFYDELYPGTGTAQQGITEIGQVRMGENVTPWNHTALYEQQSAIFNVARITTPFMILQGTKDNAVDWDQGLELYNAARRNGKQVIFLSYPGEPHHLGKKPNQIDFQIRMKQFFDHYLKGAPEPDWMQHGVPQVHKGEPIR